jgi:hypothetical protein
VAEELRAVARVFAGKHSWCAWAGKSFEVGFCTDPVVLRDPDTGRDFPLGRFDAAATVHVAGDYDRHVRPVFTEARAFALEPNPAEGSDGATTHPHVSEDEVCTGEGGPVMDKAACQGRPCDVLDVLDAVLRTYNESSPHRRLSQWNGHRCDNCETFLDPEDDRTYSCNGCGDEVCTHCVHNCDNCNEGTWCRSCYQNNTTPLIEGRYCDDCTTACDHCSTVFRADGNNHRCAACRARECEDCGEVSDDGLDEGVCPACGERCHDCRELFRPKELNVDGQCENCGQDADDEDEDEAPAPAATAAEADTQPRCDKCKRFAKADELMAGVCARCAGDEELAAVTRERRARRE